MVTMPETVMEKLPAAPKEVDGELVLRLHLERDWD